jgi:long-chain acyl-CoA synthetase
MTDSTKAQQDDGATLASVFAARVASSQQACAYRQFDAVQKIWVDYSWTEIGERVRRWRRALDALAVSDQGRVAILLGNSVNAVCIDQAALAGAQVPVPLNAIDNPESIAYIVGNCEAEVLVLQEVALWQSIAALGAELPHLATVIVLGAAPVPAAGAAAGPRVVGLETWLEEGSRSSAPAARAPRPDDLAAIVYTSGTTGKPKGVMLTHSNVVENMRAVKQRVLPLASDVFLSFLPLSHTFERTAGYYLPIECGSCVAYVRSVPQIVEDLGTIRPTVLISVPRIYERFYSKVQERLQRDATGLRLFNLAVDVGWRRFCRQQGMAIEGGGNRLVDALAWPLLKALVANKVLAPLGGRLRVAVSGGAPLSQAVGRCFIGLGLPLLQGYGMTETSPVIAVNSIDDNWPSTVGRALPGVAVRIGEDRELQVKAPSVMKGYWKRPEDTARVFTDDGWLRTGDQAGLEDGRIRILGRIKEIIVTSTGEKIAPADLELAIGADALFEQVLVIGENRPFISAFVVLNGEQWQAFAQTQKVPADAASLTREDVRQALARRVQALTRSFPRYAVPRVVRASLEPWSIQNGLMTATLKLKRTPLEAYLKAQIDEVYRGRGDH